MLVCSSPDGSSLVGRWWWRRAPLGEWANALPCATAGGADASLLVCSSPYGSSLVGRWWWRRALLGEWVNVSSCATAGGADPSVGKNLC